MNPSQHRPSAHAKAFGRGLSLVELLISMVIGLVVIGAILPAYLTTGTGQSSNAALSQIAEDATLALNILRKQITLAGYSRPFRFSNTGFDRAYPGRAVVGCDSANFDNPTAATIAELTCTGAAGNNSIAIAYEADTDNAVMTADTIPRPRDCAGNGIAPTLAVTGGAPQHWVAESRFYIDANNALRCQGNGQNALPVVSVPLTANDVPLVNNIENMRIRYGVSNNINVTGINSAVVSRPGPTPARFLTATQMRTTDPTGGIWNNVTAVRICIVVRSEQEVLDAVTPYYDCNAIEATNPAVTTPTDRRLYKAFSTTVMIKNRLGGV